MRIWHPDARPQSPPAASHFQSRIGSVCKVGEGRRKEAGISFGGKEGEGRRRLTLFPPLWKHKQSKRRRDRICGRVSDAKIPLPHTPLINLAKGPLSLVPYVLLNLLLSSRQPAGLLDAG